MPSHPLAEVFGFPYDNLSQHPERYRRMKLCPYNNRVPSCTKNSVKDPLGVCSVFENEQPVITCPVRFRQNWLIIEDAANFFFPGDVTWTALREVRLNDAEGNSAGDVDFVLVALDEQEKIVDFGALEVQAVYISGNVSNPFNYYMQHRHETPNFLWERYVRPDYLSSSRKRLVPQLIYKGRILLRWQKHMAVAVQDNFFATLPELPSVSSEEADIAWFVYRMAHDREQNLYELVRERIVYTQLTPALTAITTPPVGDVNDFVSRLQDKLNREEQVYPPVTLSLLDSNKEGEV